MDLVFQYLAQIDSAHTRRAYRRDLTHFIEHLNSTGRKDIAESSINDIRTFIDTLQSEGLSRSTQQRRLSALRRFFDWLVGQDYSDRNPARACQVDLTHPTNLDSERDGASASVLTKSETETLIQSTEDAGEATVRDRALLLTILYGALRRAETAAMNVEHVRPLGRHWVIDVPAGESWSSAYVKIPETVTEAIDRVQSRYDINTGALWRSLSNRNRGARMTPDAIYKVVRRTAERAGFGNVTVETLRRTGLHLAVNAGASIQQVQLHGRLKLASSMEWLTNTGRTRSRLNENAVDFVELDIGTD